jgi:hypothetical protein
MMRSTNPMLLLAMTEAGLSPASARLIAECARAADELELGSIQTASKADLRRAAELAIGRADIGSDAMALRMAHLLTKPDWMPGDAR